MGGGVDVNRQIDRRHAQPRQPIRHQVAHKDRVLSDVEAYEQKSLRRTDDAGNVR